MVYKRFTTICTLRLVFLTLSLAGTIYFLLQLKITSLVIILALFSCYQLYALIHYVNKTNRDLTRFIESIRYSDFSQSFKDEGMGRSFSALQGAMSEVLEKFRKTRAEKEEHYQYLQTVVQHIGMGLIVFRATGEIELMNNAVKQLLKVPRLRSISQLGKLSPELVETLMRLPSREKAFVKIEDENESLYLALYATEFKMGSERYRLVSLQNIHRELEEKEMEAWQKLIRVLTHEIMNSVTPISSLASTINDLVQGRESLANPLRPQDDEWLQDIQMAAKTIEKRSQGLLRFVDSFRTLTLVPKPRIQIFAVTELFERVERLMKVHISGKNIHFSRQIEPRSLQMEADPDLVEQILINLLMNALQALGGKKGGAIQLKASLNYRGRVVLQVSDNGPGISPENLEKIFVPFFSTKEGGSGIGLSLSRQIMRLHHGGIRVQSETDSGTTFYLTF
ncbi:ATP-binding protein [candidate division KSB1 bacterium]|nr:ATP-binding protein [candidate division KSB1 bacterium]